MDINILLQPLNADDHPGLETGDPRLSDIASLAQDGDYMAAAAAAQEVFEGGMVDVRLLGFFLYGMFLEQGIRSLGEIFGGAAEFLESNWETAGPKEKRGKHTLTAFRWLFNQMSRKLQFEESSHGTVWREWLEKTTVEEAAEALAGVEILDGALHQVLGETAGELTNGLVKIGGMLRSFGQLVEQQEETLSGDGQEDTWEEDETSYDISSSTAASDGEPGDAGLHIEGSYALGELMRKLDAFELLMSREKYQQAALVAETIFEAIENFDPLLYFPKLFRRFFLLYVRNNEELLGFDEMRETREWSLFREYFKVDRDGFIDL